LALYHILISVKNCASVWNLAFLPLIWTLFHLTATLKENRLLLSTAEIYPRDSTFRRCKVRADTRVGSLARSLKRQSKPATLRATACNAKRVFATAEASVRPSVCHTAVLCQNDATEDHEIFTVVYRKDSSFFPFFLVPFVKGLSFSRPNVALMILTPQSKNSSRAPVLETGLYGENCLISTR